jgi:inosine/xanthosine triphosphate pyrophosphatase family protein
MTAAELTEEQKNSISHRGKALLAFKRELPKITADLNSET